MPHASRGDVVVRDLAAEINALCTIRVELDARVYRWQNPFPRRAARARGLAAQPRLPRHRSGTCAPRAQVEAQQGEADRRLRESRRTRSAGSHDFAGPGTAVARGGACCVRAGAASAAGRGCFSRRPLAPSGDASDANPRAPVASCPAHQPSRDDGSDSHGDPDPLPPAALLGWPLANFVLLNADLGGPERLAKFMKQPGSVQSAAWAGLRDAIERRRASEGVVA